MIYTILVPLSFLFSLICVYVLKNQFSSYLIDIPNERSSHSQPTPRGGGLGFVMAFLITSWWFSWLFTEPTVNVGHLWLVLAPLTVVGLLDDRWHIPAKLRYLVQLVSASIAISLFGIFPQPWFSSLGRAGVTVAILLTLLGFTALINFYNFMDGLDGLLAGITIIQMVFLAVMANQPLWLVLVGAIAGFLWWNWCPAKIFMGDVGSTFLGAVVAIALICYSNQVSEVSYVSAWTALTITLPITGDAIYTLICRLFRRENIFQPHRSHVYQRLHKCGWNHSQVAITYMSLTSVMALNIYLFSTIGAWGNLLLTVTAIAVAELYLRKFTISSGKETLTKNAKSADSPNYE